MKTRDRIVAMSLKLFNEQGERNVTTNHIAAALAISPGNLYYHFRNKDAIVAALFEQMTARFEGVLAQGRDGDLSLPHLFSFLDGLFDSLWRYRFFNRNLPHLLDRDPVLARAYAAYVARMKEHMRLLLEVLNGQGILKLAPDDYPHLVENTWLVGTFWLNYQETAFPERAITEASVRKGIVQLLHLFRPYVVAEADSLYQELMTYYSGDAAPLASLG